MGLLSDTNLKAATDKLARLYEEFAGFMSPNPNLTLTTGVLLQAVANNLLQISLTAADYNVESDLNAAFYTVAGSLNASSLMVANFATSLSALNTHYAGQSTAGSLPAYLLAENNPSGSLPLYITLLDPWFQDFWTAWNGTALDVESTMQKPIHPSWTGTAYTNVQAMGNYTVAGGVGYLAGYSCNANYGAVIPTIEVVANFVGGTAPPTVVVAGLDALGNAVNWTATVTGGNNPTAAVATTITPAITTASARLTVALASTTGIVVGSILTVNAGLVDQEVIQVEAVAGSTITAVFMLNHNAGAAITGNTTWVTSPSVSTSRLRSVTGITVTTVGHTAGTVRVIGPPARQAI